MLTAGRPETTRQTGKRQYSATKFRAPACDLPTFMPGEINGGELHPDLPIDPCSDGDGHMRPPGKIPISLGAACVELIGKRQQSRDRGPYLSRHQTVGIVSRGENRPGVGVTDPGPGQVPPVHLSVLEHISRDVGQLHRDAKIDGMRPRRGRMAVKNMAHQQTDRAGDPVGISQKRRFIGEGHDIILILQQTVHKGDQNVRRKALFRHQRQERTQRRVVPGPPGQQVSPDRGQAGRTVFDVTVSHVVEKAAKGVQTGGIASHARTQKPPCPMETLAVRGQRLLGCQLFIRRHCRPPPSGRARQVPGASLLLFFDQTLDNLSRTQHAWHHCSGMRSGCGEI